MKTLKVHSEIHADGVLRLEVSTGLRPGPAEVTLLVQPEIASLPAAKARSGLFLAESAGAGQPEAGIKELNAQWQAKLEDLKP